MESKSSNKHLPCASAKPKRGETPVKQLWIFLFLAILHTLPLWNLDKNLAGGYGDPFTHATIGEWYCKNVVTGNFHSDFYMSPYGVSMAGTYDSPFPFILTCPFVSAGSLFQFHLFALIQIFLILFSAWLVAKTFFKDKPLRFCYVLFVWWCGFYITRSHQHLTLLSVIWGLQFVLYAAWTINPKTLKGVLIPGLLMALTLVGTFYNIASLLFFAVLLMGYRLWLQRKDFNVRALLNLAYGLILFSALFLLFWGPMIYFILKNGQTNVEMQRKVFNLDLLSPFLPFEGNLIYQLWEGAPRFNFERASPFDPIMIILVFASIFKKEFWQDRWRVLILLLASFYFVMALGPELRINNEVAGYLDFNGTLLDLIPFKFSRTPGRFAAITNLSFIFLGFLFLDRLRSRRLYKYIPLMLGVWIIITGPLLNQMWFFPTIEYRSIVPMVGLESLKKLPVEATVVSIPSAWAQDPTQNFNRIFHGKNITSAYLAYITYNQELIRPFSQDPFLGKMGCQSEITAFSKTPLLSNFDELHKYLIANNLRGFVVNMEILVGQPACKDLALWTIEFLKLPWVRVTEEKGRFITAELL
jgi:hypothetical protein